MDTEKRLLGEDEVAANLLFGCTEGEFLLKLPEVFTWVRHLPFGNYEQMARECSTQRDVDELRRMITFWRRTAKEYAHPMVTVPAPKDVNATDLTGFTLDFETGVMYVYLDGPAGAVERTVEVTPWLLVDYGQDGRAVGVEFLTLDLRNVQK